MENYVYSDGFSVSLPANITFTDFGAGHKDLLAGFYNENGQKAGTCMWTGSNWL
ncbi:MAG: hypothetical protein LBT33_04170 [Spirochaetia bacterium]|jgi:hypothetical protein|nr:hypothetical protein [Spirochaetia bacterium]